MVVKSRVFDKHISIFADDYRNFVEHPISEHLGMDPIIADNDKDKEDKVQAASQTGRLAISERQGGNIKLKDNDEQAKHFKHLFSDDSCDFYCKVLFANDFEGFREKILPSGTDLILSLSECSRFKASGGKSGVKFFKTTDERFLLKELNRMEARDVSTFIPKYLDYIAKAHADGSGNTLLAKIFGVFDVGYKNSVTGRQSGIMFILMENLTYGRANITGSYDLKGSRR